jgi:hypothetical protein
MKKVFQQLAANRNSGGGLFPNTGSGGTLNSALTKIGNNKFRTGQLFPDMSSLGGVQRSYITQGLRKMF